MKQIILTLLLAFSLFSCERHNTDVKQINVSQQVIHFSDQVLSQKVVVDANCSWNIKATNKGLGTSSCIINWIEITPYFGDKGSKEIHMNVITGKKPKAKDSFKIFLEDQNGEILTGLTIEYNPTR